MYKTKKSLLGKIMSCVLAVAMLMSMSAVSAFAAGTTTELEEGSYTIDASLSCYVDAMGGIEFAEAFEANSMGAYGTSGVFDSATLTVDESGNEYVTVKFGKGAGVIYTMAFQSFVDGAYSLKYYDADHALQDVTSYTEEDFSITKTDNTVYESTCVTSVTFPLVLDEAATVYDKDSKAAVSAGNSAESTTVVIDLWFVVNSNVMGLQFCDGSGTAGSNTFETATKYVAALTLDLSSAEKIAVADETSNQSATVEYTVTGGYEVEIPATITVDSTTKRGSYTVTAQNFILDEGAYVTVTASESGKLVSGSNEIAFTNTLEDGKLTKTGDTLAGEVAVTEDASNPGKYTGTIDFVISYFKGE